MPAALGYRAERFTTFDGLTLFYRDYGDRHGTALPLLCLPGLARNSHDFHHFALSHAPRRRVLCVDYRGRGLSQWDADWRHYHPVTYLNDIRHLLIRTGVHRAVVVGTSMGGILAMAMGALMPTALGGVLLNDVGPDIDPRGLTRIAAYLARDPAYPDWQTAIAGLRQTMPGLAGYGDAVWRDIAEGTYVEDADGVLHPAWDTALARSILDAKGAIPDLWPLYRSLRGIPVAAVRGATSDILTADTFARMAVENPSLIHATIDNVGHVPQMNEPAITEALDELLADN